MSHDSSSTRAQASSPSPLDSAPDSASDSAQSPKRRRRRRKKRGAHLSGGQERSPLAERDDSAGASSHASRGGSKPTDRGSKNKPRGRSRDGSRDDRRSPRKPQKTSSARERLKRAVELIDSVVREEAIQRGVMRLSTLHLNLTIGEGESTDQAPSKGQITRQVDKLKEQLEGQVRALVPAQFQRGAVYCFHSDQGVEPPTPDAVFTGHDLLGRPQWMSFLPFCLHEQIPHIDQLYADPPRAIGVMMPAPIGAQLIDEVTQGRIYEVLAQLVIGPLTSHFRALSSSDTRHTLTAQVILVQSPDQPLRIRFNLLGLNPDDLFDEAAKSAPRAPISRARNSISAARHATRRLQERFTHGKVSRSRLTHEGEAILADLRDALLRSLSGDQQRTRHAQRRHQSMERPTSEAWRDAARAGDERLFWDGHQETIVVIGPKGRAHVFSPDGKHVTSMRLGVGELDRKRGQRRWLLLEPQRASAFRLRIRGDAP